MNPRGRLYIGSTENLRRRVQQHNALHDREHMTSLEGGPWHVLDARAMPSTTTARAAERAVQQDQGLKALWLHALAERMGALMRHHARSRTRWDGMTDYLRPQVYQRYPTRRSSTCC